MKLKVAILMFFLLSILACKTDHPTLNNYKTISECPLKEITNRTSQEKIADGTQINGVIKAELEANMNKFIKSPSGKLEIQLFDTTNANLIKKELTETIQYSSDFLEKHNSIVQIICSIYDDLSDTTLSKVSRELLEKEKIKKRTEYFNFLLDQNRSSSKGKNDDNSEKVVKKDSVKLNLKPSKKSSPLRKDDYNKNSKPETNNNPQVIISSHNQKGGITAYKVEFHEGEQKKTPVNIFEETIKTINPSILDSLEKNKYILVIAQKRKMEPNHY